MELSKFMQTAEFKEDCEKAQLFHDYGYRLNENGTSYASSHPYLRKAALTSIKVCQNYFWPVLFEKINTKYASMQSALDTANNSGDWELLGKYASTGVGQISGTGAAGYAHNYTRQMLIDNHFVGVNSRNEKSIEKMLDTIQENLEGATSDFLLSKRLGSIPCTILNHINVLKGELAVYEAIAVPQYDTKLPEWKKRLEDNQALLFDLYKTKSAGILSKFDYPNDSWQMTEDKGNALREKIKDLYISKTDQTPEKIILNQSELKEVKFISENLEPVHLSAITFIALVEDSESNLIYDLGWYEHDQVSNGTDIFVEHTISLSKPEPVVQVEEDTEEQEKQEEAARELEIKKMQEEAMAEAKRMQEEAMAAAQKAVEEAQRQAQEMMKQMNNNNS